MPRLGEWGSASTRVEEASLQVITERDIHARLVTHRKKCVRRQGSTLDLEPGRAIVTDEHEVWLESYWKPLCEKKRLEGMTERFGKTRALPDRRLSASEQ